MPFMLHFGEDALPCSGGTPAIELSLFVESNLTTDEIMDLGRRIAERHGLNTFGPLDRRGTADWFERAIAGSITPADATRYVRELERRKLEGEPLVRAFAAAGSAAALRS